jgi:uncharacterized protein YqhQ
MHSQSETSSSGLLSSNDQKKGDDLLIGGQAVIEGVMMRSPLYFTVAVRKPDGSIEVKKEKVPRLTEKHRLLRLPVIRGVAGLFQALALGIRALNYSANVAMEEGQPEGGKRIPAREDSRKGTGAVTKLSTAAALVVGIGAGVILFIVVPLLLTNLLFHLSGSSSLLSLSAVLRAPANKTFAYNLIDGLIRMIIFVMYVYGISLFKEIRRVFQYHGAEHKSIHAYESGEELTVENARKHSPVHPRCGTSFLLVVMVFSILAFSVMRSDLPFWVKLSGRIVLVPVIAGISYEFLKMSAKRRNQRFFRFLVMPGLWLQKITAKEPSDDQLEVGIQALKAALEEESHPYANAAPVIDAR